MVLNIKPIRQQCEKERIKGFINRLYYVKPEQFHEISTSMPARCNVVSLWFIHYAFQNSETLLNWIQTENACWVALVGFEIRVLPFHISFKLHEAWNNRNNDWNKRHLRKWKWTIFLLFLLTRVGPVRFCFNFWLLQRTASSWSKNSLIGHIKQRTKRKKEKIFQPPK